MSPSGKLAAEEHPVAGWVEAIDAYFERGWTDGLPVVPATEEAVRPFLDAAGLAPDDLVLTEPVRRRAITAEKLAINAVLAGCRPEYMPVLRATLEAMAAPEFTLHGAITSTGGSATFIVVNGPIRRAIGLNAGSNVFGPGWRANATIGRAIRLVTLNCLGALPGVLDRSTQGHPGKYTFCIAENEEESPWEPLHVERGFGRETSTVTVFAAEGPHNVLSHYGLTADAILVTLADTMACLGSFSAGQSFVVLAPEHVAILARDGWTKPRIKESVYAQARRTRADLKRGGKLPGAIEPGDETAWVHRGVGPSLAKRVTGLDGKVLGLLANGKVNGDHLLELVQAELRSRYDVRDVVVMTKPGGASRVADDAMLEALASRCDVVVTAIGD